jgi:hypothetical protein
LRFEWHADLGCVCLHEIELTRAGPGDGPYDMAKRAERFSARDRPAERVAHAVRLLIVPDLGALGSVT